MRSSIDKVWNSQIVRSVRCQFKGRTLKAMGSATLSYIGILWMIIKLLDYAVQLNQAKMTFLNPIKSFLDDNLLYEILFIVVLAILINRNRIAAQYNLSNGYGKIVFDRCSVHHSHGNRVIEMPTSFTRSEEHTF